MKWLKEGPEKWVNKDYPTWTIIRLRGGGMYMLRRNDKTAHGFCYLTNAKKYAHDIITQERGGVQAQ